MKKENKEKQGILEYCLTMIVIISVSILTVLEMSGR